MGYEYMKVRGLCVDVSYLVMGPLENNVYILSDGKSALLWTRAWMPMPSLDLLGI